jgi:hypothetical protein
MHLPGGGTASSGRRGDNIHQVFQQGLCLKSMDFDI